VGHNVFISYSSLDQTIAEAICQALEQAGISVWIAPRDVPGGKPYGESIIDAINASRIMVVVFSANSDSSQQVLNEVERATAKRLVIIPFRIEDVLPSKSMEYFLSSYHWLDARKRPIDPYLETLVDAVKAALSTKKAFTSLLTPFSSVQARTEKAFRARVTIATFATVGLIAIVSFGVWRYIEATTLMDPNHIAVMPFRNVENDTSIDYLTREMPLALDSQLSRMAALTVVPFSSAMKFKDTNTADIAKTLHVGTLIEGTFSHDRDQLKLDVNIVDTNKDRYLWSEAFQSLFAEFRNLIERMVPKIAAALRFTAPNLTVGTQNSKAYTLYIHALALGLELSPENNAAAIEALKSATRLDPQFAEAHAALAEAYVNHFWWNMSNDISWLDLAAAEARKAQSIAPDLAEGHYALAFALEGQGRRADAAREYFASVRKGPHYIPALSSVARYEFYMGDFSRALATLDTIAGIDPTNNVHIRKAMCYFFADNRRDSATENRLAEKAARGVDQLTLVAFTYAWLKDFTSADRVLQTLERQQPGALSLYEIRAWTATMKGDKASAHEQMKYIAEQRQTFGILDELATLYAIQGDKEQAVALLSKAVSMGAPNYAWYHSDFFKALRGDARYEAILSTLVKEYAAVRRDAGIAQ
jgi:TolB-like protein/Flp pilus assembly protein TadD